MRGGGQRDFMNSFVIHHGDALAVLRGMPDSSVDAIVTDPPAGIAFMGKDWDKDKGGRGAWIDWMSQIAAECLRVLKPGAHALVWAIPRTSHWTATAWEDAGFEVRDRIAHVFGSGFPKSLDVSKAIDKMHGAEREVVGANPNLNGRHFDMKGNNYGRSAYVEQVKADITAPATEAAKHWEGWGTALKPAVEDWWLLRKPISESSIAANVLRWGTGGVNVDGCRIGTDTERGNRYNGKPPLGGKSHGIYSDHPHTKAWKVPSGRFPANLITDGSAQVVQMFPVTVSGKPGNSIRQSKGFSGIGDSGLDKSIPLTGFGDTGSAARFFKACPPDDAASMFYCAKASRSERDAGLNGMPEKACGMMEDDNYDIKTGSGNLRDTKGRNHHPTVKPQSLMRYLCRLITPPNGVILDPFFGSGSTGVAAITEGFSIIGIEQDAEFAEIARRRCEHAKPEATTEVELPPLLAACEAAA